MPVDASKITVPLFSGFHLFTIKFKNRAFENGFTAVLKPTFNAKFNGITQEDIEAMSPMDQGLLDLLQLVLETVSAFVFLSTR